MCGFFSIVSKNNSSVCGLDTKKILSFLVWRGPDSEGQWQDDSCLLLHKRLSIVDLSACGSQPMVCEDSRYVIAYNGEVYNWREIRKNLKFKKWRSQTDTETVLYAYKELGPNCVKIFNGMFAFAIWDRKSKVLFAARDHVGIKPLYFFCDKNKFLCASEIKALLAARIPKEFNMGIISDYLQWGVVDHSRGTFFKNIFALDPGSYCTVDQEKMVPTFVKYWDIYSNTKDQLLLNKEDAQKEFEFLLDSSIKQQVLADVNVGTTLSGGVDSSMLTALATEKIGTKKIKSFTYCFEGGGGEEKVAEKTAKILGIENIHCCLSSREVPDYFKKVLYHQESPVTATRVLALHKLFEETRKRGVLVLLDGSGGDEMAAGYEYYYLPYVMDMLKDHETPQVIHELNLFMDRFNIPQEKRLERLLDCLKTVLHPGVSTQDGVSFVSRKYLNDEYFNQYTVPQFEGHFSDWLRRLQLIDFSHVVLPKALRYTDRASMSSSCESRVPILDHRIVELSFRTTPHARMCNGHQRIFMRAAAEKILPPSILHRPKQTIVDPQRLWLKRELKEWVYDVFNSQTARNLNFLNIPRVIQEYEDYLNTESPRTSAHIFQYLNIITWYHVFFENGYYC